MITFSRNLLKKNFCLNFTDIGADIVDVTNQESRKFGNFNLKDTWFQLSPNQQTHFEEVRRLNNYLREKFHSLRDILWKAGYTSYYNFMPERYRSSV